MSTGVRVLRVEHHRFRHGPYGNYGGRVSPWPAEVDPELRKRPLPSEDGMARWVMFREVRFGFASFAQFRWWFPRYVRDSLDGYGYVLAIYEVDPAAIDAGGRQVAFDVRAARHVRDLYLVSKRHSSLEPAF